MTICGSVLSAVGFFASSWAPNVYVLYLTYGALTGSCTRTRAQTSTRTTNTDTNKHWLKGDQCLRGLPTYGVLAGADTHTHTHTHTHLLMAFNVTCSS